MPKNKEQEDFIFLQIGEVEELAEEQLSFYDFSTPETSYKSIDKLTHILSLPQMQGTPENNYQTGAETKITKKAPATLDIDFRGAKGTLKKTTQKISKLDEALTDAVARLIDQGQTQFTVAQIIKEYKATNQNARPDQIQQIEEKIDRLTVIRGTIGLEGLAEQRKQDDEQISIDIEDYWLPLRKFTGKRKNQYGSQQFSVYVAQERPLIARYQEVLANGGNPQRITYSKRLVALPNKSQTDIRVIISRELIEHIFSLINKKNKYKQEVITLERLEAAVHSDYPEARRETITKIIKEYLDAYKNKEHLITSYTVNKRGKSIYSYRIKPNYNYKID